MQFHRYFIIFVFCVFSSQLSAENALLREPFNGTFQQLRSKGWFVDVSLAKIDGYPCIELKNSNKDRVWISKWVSVEPGHSYVISCMMKTCDVTPGRRNATIFAEWADGQFRHQPGGDFPIGRVGTTPWSPFVLHTNIIHPNVRNILIWIALEGKGAMWVRDLIVKDTKDYDNWEYIKPVAPVENTQLDVTCPLFQWENKSDQTKYRILIGGDRELNTLIMDEPILAGEKNNFRPLEQLPKGKRLFWRVIEVAPKFTLKPRKLFATPVQSFTISPDAVPWPPTLIPQFEWSGDKRPVFIITMSGTGVPDVKADIFIDGMHANILECRNGILRFEPSCDIANGEHKIDVTLKNQKGNTLKASYTYQNYLPASRVTFHSGILSVNGKPIFPIGTFRDTSDRMYTFTGICQAGFNLSHSYYFEQATKDVSAEAEKFLTEAAKHNVNIFLGVRRDLLNNCDDGEIGKFVASKVMTLPSLLTWYVADEPILVNYPIKNIAKICATIKKKDPFHPTLIVFSPACLASPEFRAYSQIPDILGTDPYIIDRNGEMLSYSIISNSVRTLRKMAGPNRPVWAVLQVYDPDYYGRDGKKSQKIQEFGQVKRPSYMELRCMCYTALAAGADGIIFYWLPCYWYRLPEDAPEVWDGLCKTVRELKSLTKYMTYPRVPDDPFLNTVVPASCMVWSRVADDSTRVLVFINHSEMPVVFKAELPNLENKKVFMENKPVTIVENKISISLQPHDVKVYIIK